MFVTTSSKGNSRDIRLAEDLVMELGMKYINRGNHSLSQMKKKEEDLDALVVGETGLKYVYPDGTVLFFHPNLARVRITSMLSGSKDRLAKVAGVWKGDVVLDCNTGLATDAIVLSYAVGKTGQVTTVESVPIIHVLAREGLKSYDPGIKEIEDAMRRVVAVCADQLEYLKGLPDKSVDIVYFDPMFRTAARTVALTPLRGVADNSPVSTGSLAEAKRVARRTIVMREHFDSGEFERLGFEPPAHKAGARFDYGVIRLG